MVRAHTLLAWGPEAPLPEAALHCRWLGSFRSRGPLPMELRVAGSSVLKETAVPQAPFLQGLIVLSRAMKIAR